MAPDRRASPSRPPRKRRVVIDFLPVQSDGSNGGIKVMTCELGPELFRQAGEMEFVILTAAHNHAALLYLEAPNARCVRIDDPHFAGWPNFSGESAKIIDEDLTPHEDDKQVLRIPIATVAQEVRSLAPAPSAIPVQQENESPGYETDNTSQQAAVSIAAGRLSRLKRGAMNCLPERAKAALRHSRSTARHHWTMLPHYRYWAKRRARSGYERIGRSIRKTGGVAGRKLRTAASASRGVRQQAVAHIHAGRDRLATATEGIRYRWMSVNRYETLMAKTDAEQYVLLHKRFHQFEADLVFCPFAAQTFCELNTPSVTVIVDLQHRFFQKFFERTNWLARELQFRRAARNASRIVAISEWTRQTILEAMPQLPPERVTAIHIGVAERLARLDKEMIQAELAALGLEREQFLLFPANFWPHKNHARAIAAFEMFVKRHPETQLKLALTGEDTGKGAAIKEIVVAAGLAEHVVFTGYCGDDTLAALMASCKALFFPSLFEGFGIPPVEAMAMGRPVLCSNVASLPEIVEGAAITFDPIDPGAICGAIERLEFGDIDLESLRQRGYNRVETIGDASLMAERYLRVIREVLAETAPASISPAVDTRHAA